MPYAAAYTDPTAIVIHQIHSECCPLDRKRLAKLVEAVRAPLEGLAALKKQRRGRQLH